MTLSSESRKSQLFTGSGSTGPFPFTFKVFAKEDLVVTTSVIATGVETTLALDTDYTVLLNKDQDGNPGGSVTLKNGVGEHGPLPTTKRLLISGGMSLTQPQEVGNQDGFFVLSLPPGRRIILVRAIGFEPLADTLEITESLVRDFLGIGAGSTGIAGK